MKIGIKQDGKQITLSLHGELDHHAARGLMKEIADMVDTRLPMHCVIDMAGVDFMDSSGIAVILGAFRRMRELGGALTVINVSKQAARVFMAAGINKLVPMEYQCAPGA